VFCANSEITIDGPCFPLCEGCNLNYFLGHDGVVPRISAEVGYPSA
jgi:hypothetical protein